MSSKTSPMQVNIPRWLAAAVVLTVVVGAWLVFEVTAQRTVLRDVIGVFRDPDHRLRANDKGAGTNSDGLRCAFEVDEIPDDAIRILFLGDSFVFGVQVSPEEALPQRFEAGLLAACPDASITVINAAWPSASPYLALRLLEDLGEKYRPDIVVYGFDMTDFRDDLMYEQLVEQRGVYRLAKHAPATLWLMNRGAKRVFSETRYRRLFRMPADRFFVVNRPLSESRSFMERSWSNLESLNEHCRSVLGADFYLVVLPRNFQYSRRESPLTWEKGQYNNLGEYVHEPFLFFAGKAPTAPFPMSSLLPAFRETRVFPTCFAGDPHWTPAGTEVAAEGMVRIAVEQRWIDQGD